MSLLSHALLAALGAAMVCAVVATVLLWPRLAGRGVMAYAGRLLAVATCQLLAIVVAALAINQHFDFYASWSELFPTTSNAQAAAVPLTIIGPKAKAHRADAVPNARVATPDPRPGQAIPIRITGVGGLSEGGFAYLPPQYSEAAHHGERFPAVLVLAGYPGHVSTLVNRLEVPSQMNRQVAAGTVHPMIMILVSPTVARPRDTECADVPAGPQVETYLSRDVPHWVDTHLRTNGRWAVLGVSTGAYCATKLATRHPSVFSAAVSMSGYIHPLEDSTTGELYGHNAALRNESDAIWVMRNRPAPRVDYLMTASRTERQVYPQLKEFASVVHPPATLATLIEPSGGHNFGVWVKELPTCLQWLSARLA